MGDQTRFQINLGPKDLRFGSREARLGLLYYHKLYRNLP
jgi:hypothetical protein